MSYKLRILSLGAGVQSTTILLMSHHGELPKLDAAIFSDTGWEREATYLRLDYLRSIVSIPIITVSGGNVREDMREAQVRGLKKDGVRWANMPFYTRDRSTGNLGMLRRQCTREYKVEPIRKGSPDAWPCTSPESTARGRGAMGGDIGGRGTSGMGAFA